MLTNGPSVETGPARASDIAYDEIRARIVDLRLWPGTTVDEKTLAADLGLGRTPVREALLRLGADRLLTVLPRRGLLVPPIGFGEIRELFEARQTVECGIARLAARSADPTDLDVFGQLLKTAEGSRLRADFNSYLEDDQAVHRHLAKMSKNVFLSDAADRILRQNLRFWRYYFSERPFSPDSLISHKPLYDALVRQDPDEAEKAMADHVEQSRLLLHALF